MHKGGEWVFRPMNMDIYRSEEPEKRKSWTVKPPNHINTNICDAVSNAESIEVMTSLCKDFTGFDLHYFLNRNLNQTKMLIGKWSSTSSIRTPICVMFMAAEKQVVCVWRLISNGYLCVVVKHPPPPPPNWGWASLQTSGSVWKTRAALWHLVHHIKMPSTHHMHGDSK